MKLFLTIVVTSIALLSFGQSEGPNCRGLSGNSDDIRFEEGFLVFDVEPLFNNFSQAIPFEISFLDTGGVVLLTTTIKEASREVRLEFCSNLGIMSRFMASNHLGSCWAGLPRTILPTRKLTVSCADVLKGSSNLFKPIKFDCLADGILESDSVISPGCADGSDTSAIIVRRYKYLFYDSYLYTTDTILSMADNVRIDTTLCANDVLETGSSVISKPGRYSIIEECNCTINYLVDFHAEDSLELLTSDHYVCQREAFEITSQPAFDSYLWSTGDTTNSTTIFKPQSVHLAAVADNGCVAYSDTLDIRSHPSFEQQGICAVSYDTSTSGYWVGFERPDLAGISSYLILVEEDGQFNPVENLDVVDQISIVGIESLKSSIRFKIATVDSCGYIVESQNPAAIHQPIHVKGSELPNGDILLDWNSYEGREMLGYEVLRATTGGNYEAVDNLPPQEVQYLDTMALFGESKYMIKGSFSEPCLIDGQVIDGTFSNFTTVNRRHGLIHQIDQVVSIFPNPTRGKFTIGDPPERPMEVIDLWGSVVEILPGQREQDIGHLSPGIYFIQWMVNGQREVTKLILL